MPIFSMWSTRLQVVSHCTCKRSFWPSSLSTVLNLIPHAFAFNQPHTLSAPHNSCFSSILLSAVCAFYSALAARKERSLFNVCVVEMLFWILLQMPTGKVGSYYSETLIWLRDLLFNLTFGGVLRPFDYEIIQHQLSFSINVAMS